MKIIKNLMIMTKVLIENEKLRNEIGEKNRR